MSICQRIFERMGQDNARLRALAASIHVAPSTVTSWKVRGSDPPAKYIIAIASFLDVSPLWLLAGEPETFADKDHAHEELTELFDSLDRPGKALMLAAGYKEQLRLAAACQKMTPVSPITD